MAGLTIIFYRGGMIVAEGGAASEAAINRMRVAIDSGEATAFVINRVNNGAVVVNGFADANTVNTLLRDSASGDWNGIVRDTFGAVLGALAGLVALPAGPAAALAADVGMSTAFARAFDSASALSAQQDWGRLFDWIDRLKERARSAGFDDPLEGGSLADLEGLRNLFTQAQTAGNLSPIVLDLDGDGVETINVKDGAFFDHDGNGFAEQTGWAGADDGMLVWDRNADGRINDGKELFGNETLLASGAKAENGFQALAQLDTNADGKIDASDANWANLKVWKDSDGDGFSTAGELLSLTDLGIQSINTGYSTSSLIDANGNEHRQLGSFTRTDNTTGAATDVWFKRDLMFTIAETSLAVPADIAALPDLQGFGNVYDLHQAIVRDAGGTLKTLVQSFNTQTDVTTRNTTFEQLLFKWTGSEAIDPASRGGSIDARKLAVLEALFGQGFAGIGGANPNVNAAALLNQSYQGVFELMYARSQRL